MVRLVIAVIVVLVTSACSKDSSEGDRARVRGLPPPEQVELPEPQTGQTFGKTAAAPTAPRKADPHAGMDIANDPRAALYAKSKPAEEADPHGGGQAVDPSKFIRGTIAVDSGQADKVKPGDILFLSVARAGAGGETVAMARVEVTELPMAFDISKGTAVFVGEGGFDGDVVVVARVDRDGEARTRTPGDIEGRAAVTISAEGVSITLDTAVE